MEKLQMGADCGKLVVRDGWVICPVCKKGKLLLVRPDTVVRNLPLKCKLCKQESLVNIDERLSQCRTSTSA